MRWMLLIGMTTSLTSAVLADELLLHRFERQQLSDVYFSEGISFGDLNNDGHHDVVYGPVWFPGPKFDRRMELAPAIPQDRNRYADNFFSWVYDFNADGWRDVLVVGFPGTPAYVYENPGEQGHAAHWPRHQVFDWVSNESPHFTNIVGDARPELVCTRDGHFGFATVDWSAPFESWKFHPISEQVTAKRFGHGLGVGDIDGDGREDLIHAGGWFQQPPSDAETSRWRSHQVRLTDAYGGAEMYAYDVNGDGLNDVITSLAAHDFGLAWYEQVREGEEVTFQQHLIMGQHPSQNRYGVVFSELHSVNLADIDGDGLKDIVTGKTYYSHHQQSPQWDAGEVVYWFKLVRDEKGVNWIPSLVDEEAGIGRQVRVGDIDRDGDLDILTGGMVGAHVLRQHRVSVSPEEWSSAQPQLYTGPQLPNVEDAVQLRGEHPDLNTDGVWDGAIEGETLTASLKTTAGQLRSQEMAGFSEGRWSGGSQLFWTGGAPGDQLTLPLNANSNTVTLEVVFTCARDYGIIQLTIDDAPLGPPIDLYEPNVVTTGVIRFEDVRLTPQSKFGIQIVGANRRAQQRFFVGLDAFKLSPGE